MWSLLFVTCVCIIYWMALGLLCYRSRREVSIYSKEYFGQIKYQWFVKNSWKLSFLGGVGERLLVDKVGSNKRLVNGNYYDKKSVISGGLPHTNFWSMLLWRAKLLDQHLLEILILLAVWVFASIDGIIVWWFVVTKMLVSNLSK